MHVGKTLAKKVDHPLAIEFGDHHLDVFLRNFVVMDGHITLHVDYLPSPKTKGCWCSFCKTRELRRGVVILISRNTNGWWYIDEFKVPHLVTLK